MIRRFAIRRRRKMNQPQSRARSSALPEPPAWTFFRQWLKNPRAMAALAPSSRHLADAMMAQLPPGTRRVVELGAGTGVFTSTLLEHGIAPADLVVVELNAELHALLVARFPDVHVVRGDARDLRAIVRAEGFDESDSMDAAVSGLGFLAMPRMIQRAILEAVFSVLGPGRPLIQFTYGPLGPLPRELLRELSLEATRVGAVWRNVPPANIYTYRRV